MRIASAYRDHVTLFSCSSMRTSISLHGPPRACQPSFPTLLLPLEDLKVTWSLSSIQVCVKGCMRSLKIISLEGSIHVLYHVTRLHIGQDCYRSTILDEPWLKFTFQAKTNIFEDFFFLPEPDMFPFRPPSCQKVW